MKSTTEEPTVTPYETEKAELATMTPTEQAAYARILTFRLQGIAVTDRQRDARHLTILADLSASR